MSDYVPYVGRLDNGDEILVTLQSTRYRFTLVAGGSQPDAHFAAPAVSDFNQIDSVEVAFRPVGARTWGPPVSLERAP